MTPPALRSLARLLTHIHDAGPRHVAQGRGQEKKGIKGLLGIHAGIWVPRSSAPKQEEGRQAGELPQEHAHCLEEGMLEAVLLAPSAARGHEVVCPPAAERKRRSKPWHRTSSATLALGSVDKLAPLNAKGPNLGVLVQHEIPLQEASSRSTKSSSGIMDSKRRGARNL